MTTENKINELLAVEVMGWIYRDEPVISQPNKEDKPFPRYTRKTGHWFFDEAMVMVVKDWNPAENIAQALECAKTYVKKQGLILDIKYDLNYEVIIGDSYAYYGSDLAKVLCNALMKELKAKGIEVKGGV